MEDNENNPYTKVKQPGKPQQSLAHCPVVCTNKNAIKDEIYEQIKSQNNPKQHGFFKSRSVQANMVNFTQRVLTELDMGDTGGYGVH